MIQAILIAAGHVAIVVEFGWVGLLVCALHVASLTASLR